MHKRLLSIFTVFIVVACWGAPAYAGGGQVTLQQINPQGDVYKAACEENRSPCFLTMKIPLLVSSADEKGTAQEVVEVGVILTSETIQVKFKENGQDLSIYRQGREDFYETIPGNEGRMYGLKLYRLAQSAANDPMIPRLPVVRAPNDFLAEINLSFNH